MTSEEVKEKAKAVRQEADQRRLIELGHRKLNGPTNGEREIVSAKSGIPNLSNEMYARLLPNGKSLPGGNGIILSKGKLSSENQRKASTSSSSSQNHSRAIFLKGLTRDTHVRELVQFLERTYNITVRRARLEMAHQFSITPTCYAHIDLSCPKDVTVLLAATNKLAGGKGVYFENRPIGILSNSRYDQIDDSSPSSIVPRLSEAPAIDDHYSSNDIAKLCFSVYSEALKETENAEGRWILNTHACAAFRAHLPATKNNNELAAAGSSEDIKLRLRQARCKAILGGFIEMGRWRTHDNGTNTDKVVAVSLAHKFDNTLSKLLFLRLLPLRRDQAAAFQAFQNKRSAAGVDQHQGQNKSPVDNNIYVYMNNLHPSSKAEQFCQFLELAFGCSIQRIELEDKRFKGIPATAAHVEFVDADESTKFLRGLKASPGILVYRGRPIYVTRNRITPRNAKQHGTSFQADKSYIRNRNDETDKTADGDPNIIGDNDTRMGTGFANKTTMIDSSQSTSKDQFLVMTEYIL